jgi:hypothetical protein
MMNMACSKKPTVRTTLKNEALLDHSSRTMAKVVVRRDGRLHVVVTQDHCEDTAEGDHHELAQLQLHERIYD